MSHSTRQILIKSLTAALVVIVGALGWTGYKLWRSWNSVEKFPYQTEQARVLLAQARETNPPTEDDEPPPIELQVPRARPLPDEAHGAFLAVGSDNRPGFPGDRADVILLLIVPEDGSDPALVSLPRDLYIESPCTGGFARINVNLNGCGDVSGPELLSVAVEDYTGVHIDHLAIFDFEGFKAVIDEVGGVDICLEYAVRDSKAELRLPAGCTLANGEQALSWVRSRATQQFVEGRWRTLPGVNDLVRNQRQQEILLQMLVKLKEFGSLGELTDKVQSVADAFSIDEGLSLAEATQLAWGMRDLDPERVIRLQIPVRNHTTSAGAAVLLPTQSFTEILTEAYPELPDTPGIT